MIDKTSNADESIIMNSGIIKHEENEFQYTLKIPKDRIAVLIGKKGEIKRHIEEETKILLNIDSKEGEVTIIGQDAILLYTVKEIIKAIARGFNPELALLLLKQDYLFEVIDITDYAPTKNHMIRLKGRIIGSNGKSRKVIEDLTETHMTVYGKTVCLIGENERITVARRALDMLLKGSPHSKVYRWLERQRARNRHESPVQDKIS